MVSQGLRPGVSSVFFMPILDLKPSAEICIYSTMYFASEQAKRYKCTTILTFDQPLRLKSLGKQQSETPNKEIKNIILRLGDLHMDMSFLAAKGQFMWRTGLQDLLEVIC